MSPVRSKAGRNGDTSLPSSAFSVFPNSLGCIAHMPKRGWHRRCWNLEKMRLQIFRSSWDLNKFHLRRALARDTISLYSTSVPGLLAPVGAGRVPVNEKRNLRARCCILSPAYWEIRMVWNNERENVLQFFFFASSELIYVISDIFNSCKTQHPESSESALVPLKQVHPQWRLGDHMGHGKTDHLGRHEVKWQKLHENNCNRPQIYRNLTKPQCKTQWPHLQFHH